MAIKVISTEKKPIKLWLQDIDEVALEQAKNIANLPFAFRHVAIMPDAHQGFGMPIGGVLATQEVVVPNAVGVDIGCGMCAFRTELQSLDQADLKAIHQRIKQLIPVGFDHHEKKQPENLMPEMNPDMKIVRQEYESALYQIGTLGGGNHFVEIQEGSDGYIWIMIHSGSRNIGYKVAEYYNHKAVELNQKYFSSVKKEWQLAFLPLNTDHFKNYLLEMQFCVDFALANRKLMMERVKQAFAERLGDIEFNQFINIAHNYAKWENHFGQNVIVHRKGATSAKVGEKGIIPGSQGTKSYIVEGLGNPESFHSCSHGAGRVLGRKEAQRQLSLEKEKEKLDRQGILHSIQNVSDLDEAPSAYKDIDLVMENQKDLVRILIELKPLAVVKG